MLWNNIYDIILILETCSSDICRPACSLVSVMISRISLKSGNSSLFLRYLDIFRLISGYLVPATSHSDTLLTYDFNKRNYNM